MNHSSNRSAQHTVPQKVRFRWPIDFIFLSFLIYRATRIPPMWAMHTISQEDSTEMNSKRANTFGITLLTFLVVSTIVLTIWTMSVKGPAPLASAAEVDLYCTCRCDLYRLVGNRQFCCMNCDSMASAEDLMICFDHANLWDDCDFPN